MNKVKSELIEIIKSIPDEKATSIEELLDCVYVRINAIKGLQDIENDKTLSLNELKEEVENWN